MSEQIQLDYTLKTMEERSALVAKIVENAEKSKLTPHYLEILGDYVMNALSKDEKKERLYLTDNRSITINRRETSFEGLAEKFENGEDGLYGLMTNDKNIIFMPKVEITKRDVEEIPGLKELREAIKDVEERGKRATGKKKYLLKKQLIEMRRDQYVMKSEYRQPMSKGPAYNTIHKIDLSERRYVDETGEPQSTGLISLFNPEHISAILRHYNMLKAEVEGKYQDDFYYLMEDFDNLLKRALKDVPVYQDIIDLKIAQKSNLEICKTLHDKYGLNHSAEYISALWRQKIPKLIAEKEKEDYLIYHYTYEEKGKWKKCSCCGQVKLAHSRFFSKNKTSKDGWYSLCKECRNAKARNNKYKKGGV